MRSKHALDLGFPELPGLGLTVFTSVPHLVLEDLKWILKFCCRDWRLSTKIFIFSTDMGELYRMEGGKHFLISFQLKCVK